jgi:hypothetical protein
MSRFELAATVPWAALLLLVARRPVRDARGQRAPDANARRPPPARGRTRFAAYGEPKYPARLQELDYVNPDAPKGGTLYLGNPDRRTSFDKYNPFTVKGSEPTGVHILMFETLAVRSGDEPGTIYGLLAEEMLVPPDRSSITFRLNPKARFINGDPVTAADVKHSFDMITSKGASPVYRSQYEGVKGAVVLDERTIRFDLSDRTHDTIINVGTLPVFSHKWGMGADGKPKPFDQVIDEYPITSGPTRRQRRFRTPHRFRPRSELLGPRSQRAARTVQFRADCLSGCSATARSAWKRSGRQIRDHQEFTPQQYVRLHDGAKVAGRPDHQEELRIRDGQGHAGLPAQPCGVRFSGRARARGARLQLRLREDQSGNQRRRSTVFSPIRTSRPKGCPVRASSSCWSPIARSCRRKYSARPTSRRAPTPGRTRCART